VNRHFKKYIFYLLGRLFEFLGKHKNALSYYSKVIRYRFFFLDTQQRFIEIFKKTNQDSFLVLRGGAGDFLQYLPFMLKNKSLHYIVVTHFPAAKIFFKFLGINISKFYFFASDRERVVINRDLDERENIYHCPRAIFFSKNPFKKYFANNNKTGKSLVVGIHTGASQIGLDKVLPGKFVKKLINKLIVNGYEVIYFCTRDERKSLTIKQHKKISFASDLNIIKNLAKVNQCDFFIGSDSAFKTMSSMLRIPTLVILPINKINSFRDRMFLDPYTSEGTMAVYTFRNVNDFYINDALSFVENRLASTLNNKINL
jgi:ADP-heptose:LPS heptosyltransferase